MTPLFKKLNYKDQSVILVVNSPESFDAELEAMSASAKIIRDKNHLEKIDFAIIFATKQAEVDEIIQHIAPKLEGDATLWFAYPKGSSKKYICDFNRDTGWGKLGEYDLESVRQIAIDKDWSALRFRKLRYIKKLTRNEGLALSEKGKRRTKDSAGK